MAKLLKTATKAMDLKPLMAVTARLNICFSPLDILESKGRKVRGFLYSERRFEKTEYISFSSNQRPGSTTLKNMRVQCPYFTDVSSK